MRGKLRSISLRTRVLRGFFRLRYPNAINVEILNLSHIYSDVMTFAVAPTTTNEANCGLELGAKAVHVSSMLPQAVLKKADIHVLEISVPSMLHCVPLLAPRSAMVVIIEN
jgi:hypothetical protein